MNLSAKISNYHKKVFPLDVNTLRGKKKYAQRKICTLRGKFPASQMSKSKLASVLLHLLSDEKDAEQVVGHELQSRRLCSQ